MNRFFEMVAFEYKKLFKRKSTIVSLILVGSIMALLSVTSVTGNSYWHSGNNLRLLEAMKLDRETAHSKAGFIDEAFLNEAITQNALMISDDENYIINDYGKFLKSQAYISYVLPYEVAVRIINAMYEPDLTNLSTSDGIEIFNLNGIKPIDTLTGLHEKDFYEKVNQTISERINRRPALSEAEKDKHSQMMSQVKTPFYQDSYEAYSNFAQILQLLALALFVAVAVCISPVFAGEYQLKTDQILLPSKYGKNKIIYAKLFTGASFALVLSAIMLFSVFLILILIHGVSGFDMAMQTMDVFSTYPITLLQAVILSIVVTIFVTVFFAMFTMLLSSGCKSPFSAVIVSFLMLFIPAFIYISPQNRLLYQLMQLFPAKATEFFNIYSDYFFEVLGVIFSPATFYMIFSTFVSFAIIPWVYRSFKNHQIG